MFLKHMYRTLISEAVLINMGENLGEAVQYDL